VLAGERPGLAQLLLGALDHYSSLGKPLAADAGVDEGRADAPVDVNGAVTTRRACSGGQVVELLLAGVERGRYLLQHPGAPGEVQPAQCRSADLSRVASHLGQVEAGARDARDVLAGDRVPDELTVTVAAPPLARNPALKYVGGHALSSCVQS
jgi:hypothetical protein